MGLRVWCLCPALIRSRHHRFARRQHRVAQRCFEAVLVEQELGHNPFTGALYAFTNRQRNKIKCLMWEDNGFVLYYKALAEEKFKRKSFSSFPLS